MEVTTDNIRIMNQEHQKEGRQEERVLIHSSRTRRINHISYHHTNRIKSTMTPIERQSIRIYQPDPRDQFDQPHQPHQPHQPSNLPSIPLSIYSDKTFICSHCFGPCPPDRTFETVFLQGPLFCSTECLEAWDTFNTAGTCNPDDLIP